MLNDEQIFTKWQLKQKLYNEKKDVFFEKISYMVNKFRVSLTKLGTPNEIRCFDHTFMVRIYIFSLSY